EGTTMAKAARRRRIGDGGPVGGTFWFVRVRRNRRRRRTSGRNILVYESPTKSPATEDQWEEHFGL
ncbi:hypothetical protein U1Q18_004778, partial [Sarracenia purpurea var. burkii]